MRRLADSWSSSAVLREIARVARGARQRAIFWACRFCNNLAGAFVNALAAFNAERRLRRMRRGVVTGGELHREERGASCVAIMVTLTYRPEVHWRRDHISSCLAHWRDELRGRKLRYVWVMELTKAGRPHYHVVVWLPIGVRLGKPDQSGAWPYGFSRIEVARNAVGYLVKYATKGTDGVNLPRGARLFGVGGLSADSRLRRAWVMLPRYQRKRCEPGDRVVRMRGGGWIARETGEFWPAAEFLLPRLMRELEREASSGVEG